MAPWRSPHDKNAFSTLAQKRKALTFAILLSLAAFFLQVFGAWYTGSLALLGDTAHLFTDILSLSMSLTAVYLAARSSSMLLSFGLYRLEVLAAFLNGLLLLVVAFGLGYEAYERIQNPQPVLAIPLLLVSFGGLIFNLISAWLLSRAVKAGSLATHCHSHEHSHAPHDTSHQHSHEGEDHHHSDRNLQSALLHVMSDALSSVGVIMGAIVVHFTMMYWVDAVIAMLLAFLILNWSIRVLRDSGRVLLEAAPKHLKPEVISQLIQKEDERVRAVEDLHVWEITSRMYAATAELRVSEMSLEESERLRQSLHKKLESQFGIAHVVLAIRPSN